MESYNKENFLSKNLKRSSQSISNNKKILQSIRNKLYPLNSVHRPDLYLKKLKKQVNKEIASIPLKRYVRKSLMALTKPNQLDQNGYKDTQIEIYKELVQKNQQKQDKIKNCLVQLIQEKMKSQENQSLRNSDFKYQRLPKIKQQLQQKKLEFIQKNKKRFMEIQFVDRDDRNYSFQYMVKKAQLYKKQNHQARQTNSMTVYERNSPNKLKKYVALLNQKPLTIKKTMNSINSRKMIRLPNYDETQNESQKQIRTMKTKKSFKQKSLKEQTQNNQITQNCVNKSATLKMRVTQNRKKFLNIEQNKKSRSGKHDTQS